MSIHKQFWKEALSAFRRKISLHDTLIYWCNYHTSTFSNGGGEQIFIGHFTQHIETNHNLAGSFTATDLKLLTNIYIQTNKQTQIRINISQQLDSDNFKQLV